MPVIERVHAEEALARVTRALGKRGRDARLNFGQVDLTCDPADLVDALVSLRDAEDIRCRYFSFLSGVDRTEFADDPGGLEVLVHVYSPDFAIHVNVHVPVDADNPTCPSVTSVYAGAIWAERETYEMFGIEFPGHPRLVNLYLPEDFEGHPLRRSFKLPSRIIKDWPGAKDPEEAAAGGR